MCWNSWHRCPMNGRPSEMRGTRRDPRNWGVWRGSSRQLCHRDGSHCHGDGAGGQGPDEGWAPLIGATLRLSAGRPGTPHATIVLRKCVRWWWYADYALSWAYLSIIEGMWVHFFHTYSLPLVTHICFMQTPKHGHFKVAPKCNHPFDLVHIFMSCKTHSKFWDFSI